MTDINKIRADFPILNEQKTPLIYLDNAATTQKPQAVIDCLVQQYSTCNANVHRGIHSMSARTTEQFEQARETVRKFIGARNIQEIVFTKGATEGLNLAAQCIGEACIEEGDVVLVSEMEHHSNFVPWQMICQRKKAEMQLIPLADNGSLRMDMLEQLLTDRVRVIAVNHVSNTLGTINPIADIVRMAHERNIIVVVDGTQAVQHMPVDVCQLGCDIYCFSGHKMYAPTGIGVLYGKRQLLEQLPPYQFGGEMVDQVTLARTTFEELPIRFEAGTPNYIGAIALGAAIEYLQNIGMEQIQSHENALLLYAERELKRIEGMHIIGSAADKSGIVSFQLDQIHCMDLALMLDKLGIAIRSGNHCTQPIMARYGLQGTARASFALYNTTDEIDRLCEGLQKIRRLFKK